MTAIFKNLFPKFVQNVFFSRAHYIMHFGCSCALSLVWLYFLKQVFSYRFLYNSGRGVHCSSETHPLLSPAKSPFPSSPSWLLTDPTCTRAYTCTHIHTPMQKQSGWHLVTLSDHTSPSWMPSMEPQCCLWPGADPKGEQTPTSRTPLGTLQAAHNHPVSPLLSPSKAKPWKKWTPARSQKKAYHSPLRRPGKPTMWGGHTAWGDHWLTGPPEKEAATPRRMLKTIKSHGKTSLISDKNSLIQARPTSSKKASSPWERNFETPMVRMYLYRKIKQKVILF